MSFTKQLSAQSSPDSPLAVLAHVNVLVLYTGLELVSTGAADQGSELNLLTSAIRAVGGTCHIIPCGYFTTTQSPCKDRGEVAADLNTPSTQVSGQDKENRADNALPDRQIDPSSWIALVYGIGSPTNLSSNPISTLYAKPTSVQAPCRIPLLSLHYFNDTFRLERKLPIEAYTTGVVDHHQLLVESCLISSWTSSRFHIRLLDSVIEFKSEPLPALAIPKSSNVVHLSDEVQLEDEVSEPEPFSLEGKTFVFYNRDTRDTSSSNLGSITLSQDQLISVLTSLGAIVSPSVQNNCILVTNILLSPSAACEFLQVTPFWLTQILEAKAWLSPSLHYLYVPYPTKRVIGFERVYASVTGYSPSKRIFIKEMIERMGGRISYTLSADNTHLICEHPTGAKYDTARGWGHVDIINHLWLEACFDRWSMVSATNLMFVFWPKVKGVLNSIVGWKAEATLELSQSTHDMWKSLPPVLGGSEKNDFKTLDQIASESSSAKKVVTSKKGTGSVQTKRTKRPSYSETIVLCSSPLRVPMESPKQVVTAEESKKRPVPRSALKGSRTVNQVSTPISVRFDSSVISDDCKDNQSPTTISVVAWSTALGNEECSGPDELTSVSSSSSRRMNKRLRLSSTDRGPVRLLFTACKPSKEDLRTLRSMNATIVTDPTVCTHCIAESITRTEKFLISMAMGKKMVDMRWLMQSCAADMFMDEDKYPLVDTKAEERFHFLFADALAVAQRAAQGDASGPHKLYHNVEFFLSPNVSPDRSILERIILASGGKVSATLTPSFLVSGSKNTTSDLKRVIITCMDDKRAIFKDAKWAKSRKYNPEFILTGVLTQTLCFRKEFEV